MPKKSETNWADVAKIWVIGGIVLGGVATIGILAVGLLAAKRASDFDDGDESGADTPITVQGIKQTFGG